MSDKKKTADKNIPVSGPNIPKASDDDDTASILFASNTGTGAKSMSNLGTEDLAIAGEESSSVSAPDNGQFKPSSNIKSNLPSGTKTNNVASKQTPNSNSVNTELPDIPWPDVPCSVRELYKGYVDQSDPFLKPPPKMPTALPKPDPKLPKIQKHSGFSQNFSKLWEAEKKAQEKDSQMKDKDDTSK